jgi:phosphatidylglycerol lysyltransferase
MERGIELMLFRRRSFHAFSSTPRQIAASLVVLVGIFDVVSVLGNTAVAHIVSWDSALPFSVAHGTRTFVVLAGIFLILLGRGMLHGRRTAWWASLLLLSVSLISSLIQGIDLDTLVVKIALIGILIWRRQDFRARPDVLTMRRAIRAALSALALLPLYAVLGFALMRNWFVESVTFSKMVNETLARTVFMTSGGLHGDRLSSRWFLDSISFAWGAMLVYAVVMLLRPVLRPTVESSRDRRMAVDLLRRFGDTGTSYMTTWPGNTILVNGKHDAYLAYRLISNVAIVLGDPIGTIEGCSRVVDEFLDVAAVNGWAPCFYGATGRYLNEFERHGLAWVQVGEDAVIDLPRLNFRGKAWQDIRTARNHAQRDGISFRMINQATADPAIVAQLWEISNEWAGKRSLPEMNFTLGHLTDPPDPEIRTGIAIDQNERIHGFVTWLPVYARNSWVIDLMRRRDDAFRGVMEFLIAESALAFQAEGCSSVSLAAAPLAHVPREEHHHRTIERALGYFAERLDTFYHFASLVEFKRKFIPSWEPIFLAYAGPANLPRIGYALLRAYLPGLSPRDIRQLISGMGDAGVSESSTTPDNGRAPLRAVNDRLPAKSAAGTRPDAARDSAGARLTAVEEWSGETA